MPTKTRPLVELRPAADSSTRELQTIASSAALFLRDGIASVRMTDIAEAAGIGVATLYRHYQTKTKLAIEAGTFMWGHFNDFIRQVIDDSFLSLSGGERLTVLFDRYVDGYLSHPDFVRFLDEFDHLVLSEGVVMDELVSYGKAIDSFYVIFEDAYRCGLADGSVVREVDFPVFYRTVAYATMGIAQKIVKGEVIPSDDFTEERRELECLMHMARFALGITNIDEG